MWFLMLTLEELHLDKEPIKWGTPEFHRIMDCIVDKMLFVCGKE